MLRRGKIAAAIFVAEVKAARGKVALKTHRFAEATQLLRERGLIIAAAAEQFITLADGHSTAEVIQTLAAAGFAIGGLWQHEQTVENFYLGLINRQEKN